MALEFTWAKIISGQVVPLMEPYESTGNKTYQIDYCKKAADAFAELLQLCETEKLLIAWLIFEILCNFCSKWSKLGNAW